MTLEELRSAVEVAKSILTAVEEKLAVREEIARPAPPMIERVARAIEAEERDDLWARSSKCDVRRAMARAAIAAMEVDTLEAEIEKAEQLLERPTNPFAWS